ncbi:MAG: excalibur calcium-binding domain-containing protein [Anaerolineales bacterium]|nr:excalibur calcium-binding domain-containing protein [Anaerolineales bacterium]
MSKRQTKNSTTGIIILSGGFICAMCCIGTAFINLIDISSISPNPVSTSPQTIPLETVIFQTVSAAQAQTSAASTTTPVPSPLPTEVLASTITVEATATLFIFELQTNVAQPTDYVFETNTPFVFSTQPVITSIAGGCSCSSDTLNCSDFSTHESAQSCFDHCISVGAGDIHRLDEDNDGVACEGLP